MQMLVGGSTYITLDYIRTSTSKLVTASTSNVLQQLPTRYSYAVAPATRIQAVRDGT
eukprot:COSAG02_NODE_3759_length_6273_cov_2.503401_2_plen_57_part_00